MEKTIFGKKRTTKEGKPFTTYITKMTRKDGEEITVQVKFREECGVPKTLPCNIVFDKKDANYSEKIEKYVDEKTQEEKETVRRILWIQNWEEGSEYVDTSMDDFEE